MARTNIDIDEEACANVMRIHGFTSKREAVNYALREASRTLTVEQMLELEGMGWEGDLDEMRADEHADWTNR